MTRFNAMNETSGTIAMSRGSNESNEPTPPAGRRLRWQRRAGAVLQTLQFMRRRWYAVAPVAAIWVLAYVRLFIDPTPRVPLLFNWTPSLPYRVAWMQFGSRAPNRGDLIVFAYSGARQDDEQRRPQTPKLLEHREQRRAPQQQQQQQQPFYIERFPGLRGQPLFKRVGGMPGDVVTVQDRWVLVNAQRVGFARTRAHDGRPLTPIAPGVIPSGQFYVQGWSADSFDSRYRESGLVRQEQIVAIVRPLF